MKQIINGKRYNTETALQIAHYRNGLGYSDFNHLEETLYQTPKGNWFIQYAGGPMSRYSRSCGQNSWSGSNGLKVLSAQEAFEWLEEHQETDALETYFSDRLSEA